MKILKVFLIALCFIGFFIFSWRSLTKVLTYFNPNYVVLENGERGYVMNTENMLIAFLISGLLSILIFFTFKNRLKNYFLKP